MEHIYTFCEALNATYSRSYWERRIVAEVRYLMDLLYETDAEAAALLDTCVQMLWDACNKDQQITPDTAKAAEAMLAPLTPKAKQLCVLSVGHAHIDMNWMWGYQETVSLTLDTIRTVLTLMEEYPTFTYAQSQASVYHILEQFAPDLLAQVKARIREGRWEVSASTWVEHDKNMADGESISRQMLYTKRYLSNLLDIPEASMNLDFEPDTFGHSRQLPELLLQGGVCRYYHCRGYNKENIYRWRAPSGAEVLVYREPTWYLGDVNHHICDGLVTVCKQYQIDRILNVYGIGDHGGGPTRRDLDTLLDMAQWPLFPTMEFGTFRQFYDYLETRLDTFPVVDQELNYVFTGCYTSQARIKLANSIGEARLRESEVLESMAMIDRPGFRCQNKLEPGWRKLLFNQFHDILPGSGTVETREYAMGEFQKCLALAGANAAEAMIAMTAALPGSKTTRTADMAFGGGVGFNTDAGNLFRFGSAERGSGAVRHIALFNTTQFTRTDPAVITLWDWTASDDCTRFTGPNGEEYPFCCLEQGKGYWKHSYSKYRVWVTIPPMSCTVCRVDMVAKRTLNLSVRLDPRLDHITDEPVCLENDRIRVLFDPVTMKCISLVDKATGFERIDPAKPACGFTLVTEEVSHRMTSWRVGTSANIEDLNETCMIRPTKQILSGRVQQLAYEMRHGDSRIEVSYTLCEGCSNLEINCTVQWTKMGTKETGVPQLRFHLPCGYERSTYRYTIPCGVLDRPALAQDVPALGMAAAVSNDGSPSLYLACSTKYGFRGDQNGLSVNLIRSSYDPDPNPEIGTHILEMELGICDASPITLCKIAQLHRHKIISRSLTDGQSVQKQPIQVEGAIVSAIKPAETGDGLIIRLYNPTDKPLPATLGLPGHAVHTWKCNTLEHNLVQLSDAASKVALCLNPYEVCSVRMCIAT